MPITYGGQIAGSVTVLVGLIALVLPLSIIQSSFVDESRNAKADREEMKELQTMREMVEDAHYADMSDVAKMAGKPQPQPYCNPNRTVTPNPNRIVTPTPPQRAPRSKERTSCFCLP